MKFAFWTAVATLSFAPLTSNFVLAEDTLPALAKPAAHAEHKEGCECTEKCSKGCNHAKEGKHAKNHKCGCSHCDCATTGSCKAGKKEGVAACTNEGHAHEAHDAHPPQAQPSATK